MREAKYKEKFEPKLGEKFLYNGEAVLKAVKGCCCEDCYFRRPRLDECSEIDCVPDGEASLIFTEVTK